MPGGPFVHHADSFARMHGCQLDTCALSEGLACVSRIHTDRALIDVGADGLQALESIEGVSFDDLQAATAVPLRR